jgi:hypothetical protein
MPRPHASIREQKSTRRSPRGFVFFGDIYGFGADAVSADAFVNVLQLTKTWEKCLRLAKRNEASAIAFSDSIFLFQDVGDSPTSENIDQAFSRIWMTLESFISITVEHDFLLRGALSYGPYLRSSGVVGGEAVLSAHAREKLIPAPLLYIHKDVLETLPPSRLVRRMLSACTTHASRDGTEIEAAVVVPQDYDDYRDMLSRRLKAPGMPPKVTEHLKIAWQSLEHAFELQAPAKRGD